MTEKAYNTNWRVLKQDGTLNIQRVGKSKGKRSQTNDMYHYLLSIRPKQFFSIIFLMYLLINLIFATLYFMTPRGSLAGIQNDPPVRHFLDCFFFSVQTIATIGYGRISPVSITANALVTLEAFLGMFSLAHGTGLLFARFSKPTARVIFSKNAIIAKHNGQKSLIFRVANARLNQIVEANIGVTLVKNEKTLEGQDFRRLYDLKLQRSHSAMFSLSWMVIHVIDDQSPLKGMKTQDLIDHQVEIITGLSGLDETMSQTIHSRTSYTPLEILFDRRFKDMIWRDAEGRVQIDLEAIDELV